MQEMREDLGLKGNDLIVFAFINGYSQRGQGCYFGSLAYLQEVCGISRRTAIDILNSLVEKGLIRKSDVFVFGERKTGYSVCAEIALPVQKLHKESAEIAQDCAESAQKSAEIAPIYREYIDNRDSIESNIYSASKFKKPSLEEVKAFCRERGNSVDPEAFIAHYESNGWMVGRNKMKNWRQAVITWEKSHIGIRDNRRSPSQTLPQKESVLEHNLKVADRLMGTNLHAQYYGKKEGGIDEQ